MDRSKHRKCSEGVWGRVQPTSGFWRPARVASRAPGPMHDKQPHCDRRWALFSITATGIANDAVVFVRLLALRCVINSSAPLCTCNTCDRLHVHRPGPRRPPGADPLAATGGATRQQPRLVGAAHPRIHVRLARACCEARSSNACTRLFICRRRRHLPHAPTARPSAEPLPCREPPGASLGGNTAVGPEAASEWVLKSS